jgi:hypothetical protein
VSESAVRVGERATEVAESRLQKGRAAAAELLWAGSAAALASLAAVLVLELWRTNLRVPFDYLVDAVFNLMVVKAVLDHGWIGENPNLGAPFGQQLWDFPSSNGDALQLAIVKGLGLFTHDPALVMNLFFLLTFPLTAAVAFLVLRALGASRASSLVCALLYSLLPFHFERDAHVFLASYYTVPLGCYLALSVLRGKPLISRAAPGVTALTLVLCLIVGSSSTYYAAFTVTLIAIATLVALISGGGLRALASGAATAGVIGATVLALLLPTLLYWDDHGRHNIELRPPSDTESYSLKLPQLVLPVAGHRVQELAELRQRYNANFGLTEGASNALGAVGTVGLFVLLGTLIAAPMRWRRRSGLLDASAALTAGLLMLALTGGLAALFSLYINPQIRAWNRTSVFIGFFALVAIAILLDRLGALLRGRRYGALLAPAVLAVVLVVGVLDQTSRPNAAQRDLTADGYRSDERFFRALERGLGKGEIFQLPAVRFPEFGWVHRMSDYDHARGYLHTSTKLRWSYGAVKGRPEDWTAALGTVPSQQIAAAATAAGFDGVYVDRAAYPDGGLSLEEELRQVLQVEPLVSGDQRLSFYDSRLLAQTLRTRYSSTELEALRVATLRPLEVTWREGFYDAESDDRQVWHWAGPSASIGLAASGVKRVVRFRALVNTGHEAPYETTVRYPDGYVHRFRASAAGILTERQFELRPGLNLIRFETTAPPSGTDPADPRPLNLRVVDASVTEPAVEAFSPEGLRGRMPLAHFGAGWFPPERDHAGRPFRSMGPRATMIVTRGGRQTGLLVSFSATSFEQPRTLTARLGTNELARVTIPAGSTRTVEVPIPAGESDAAVELAVDPPAQPTARVAQDARPLLGLRIYEVAVQVSTR